MEHKQIDGVLSKHPSLADIDLYQKEAHGEFILKVEHFENDTYLDNIIKKPWGNEYRIFADNFFDIWKLSISKGCKTSMHCHPRKDTTLLCLSGKGRIYFLDDNLIVTEGNYIHIGRGVFHSTENLQNVDLELIEVEMPRNKFDLVRVHDKYGRQRSHYESLEKSTEQITAMNQVLNSGLGKLRATDTNGRYNILLTKEFDLRLYPNLLFAISIGFEQALNQRIDVYNSVNLEDIDINSENVYLIITKVEE
jgi:mannose-6-phosphate isomerase-like protein (cupin superfamily)